MSAPVPPHDAQRELEQRALRNVRGLVEKMDGIEKIDRRDQKRLFASIVVGALVVMGAIVASVVYISNRHAGTAVTIESSKPPALQPGPPK